MNARNIEHIRTTRGIDMSDTYVCRLFQDSENTYVKRQRRIRWNDDEIDALLNGILNHNIYIEYDYKTC
jgi:hypothetical protein